MQSLHQYRKESAEIKGKSASLAPDPDSRMREWERAPWKESHSVDGRPRQNASSLSLRLAAGGGAVCFLKGQSSKSQGRETHQVATFEEIWLKQAQPKSPTVPRSLFTATKGLEKA